MKKMILFVLGTWDYIMAFLSPLWLTVVYMCLSGKVHLLDSTFNENLAGVFGILMLLLWIAAVLVPIAAFFFGIRRSGKKKILIALLVMIVLVFLCFLVCGWDTAGFLASL